MRLLSGPALNADNERLIEDTQAFERMTQLAGERGAALSDVEDLFCFDFQNARENNNEPNHLETRSEKTSASSLFENSDTQDIKYNSDAPDFLPTMSAAQTRQFQVIQGKYQSEQDGPIFEPSYKRKEKTEICKNWLRGVCRYGATCAFAHGQEEVVKKTHVAAKYKASLCNSYHAAPYYCQYGARCQFAHLTRDFGDLDNQQFKSYTHLLTENANQVEIRLNNAAKPDINTFNVALPSK